MPTAMLYRSFHAHGGRVIRREETELEARPSLEALTRVGARVPRWGRDRQGGFTGVRGGGEIVGVGRVASGKKEFKHISACKSSMEMWEKLRITYEGTDMVKETKIDILVTQYERFQMQSGETITQMYSRFTDIINGLAGLEKIYEMGDMTSKTTKTKEEQWFASKPVKEVGYQLRCWEKEEDQLGCRVL
ncbi:hypothetical protein Taro_005400 [Colocasia esculenta]|uniref:Uncharacterized protein n=1 Tax=Colocasia esculenta TaxID=4460 RepID=A0A843TXQ8_COLES|nr:hypothetical protein [Colocasia esculenta]